MGWILMLKYCKREKILVVFAVETFGDKTLHVETFGDF